MKKCICSLKEKFFTSFSKSKKLKIFLITITVSLLLVLSVIVYTNISSPNITSKQISSLLSTASELTTAKLNGTGVTFYDDSGVPGINKSNFLMIYNYTVRAGINFEKIDIDINKHNKTVHLTIPSATIIDTKVHPESINYYGESFALFNLDEREDAIKAQTVAESDAHSEAESTGILKMANDQAETLIKGLLSEVILDGYQIIISKK